MRIFAAGLFLYLIPFSAIAKPLDSLSPRSVAQRLEGQLVYQGDDFQIHMSTCAVTHQVKADVVASNLVEAPALFLYQEQARQDRLDQPYRQRLLRLQSPSEGVVTSDSYKLVEPERWVGLCRDGTSDRTFVEADLLPAHCTVTLRQQGENFIGSTPEPGCPSNYRGAAFVRNRIILTNEGMETYDQGVDAQGNRVWGADDTPYRFKKVTSP